jgi:YrhK-like protein
MDKLTIMPIMNENRPLLVEKEQYNHDEDSLLYGLGEALEPKRYPIPLSLSWRIVHAMLYTIGGITFLLGSLYYFPSMTDYELGGWLFTIGSIGFLIADLMEWYTNNRVGCFDSPVLRADFEEKMGIYMEPNDTQWGNYQRLENGLNFFYSAIGSFLYLVGSVYFIPETDSILLGTELFIAGSFVIFTSQSWKIYRQGFSPQEKRFSFSNYSSDLLSLYVDVGAGMGGLFYLIGSVYFLPEYDITNQDTIRAAALFTVGGSSFTLSAFSILYRYFVERPIRYPSSENL